MGLDTTHDSEAQNLMIEVIDAHTYNAGRPAPYRESMWTFMFRDWREVPR